MALFPSEFQTSYFAYKNFLTSFLYFTSIVVVQICIRNPINATVNFLMITMNSELCAAIDGLVFFFGAYDGQTNLCARGNYLAVRIRTGQTRGRTSMNKKEEVTNIREQNKEPAN
uniref:Uncharacterized protein n=1 Tax=Panagrolaimus sp. JU765 TaxID=591449 RepID=A0AC34RQD8_9BILA